MALVTFVVSPTPQLSDPEADETGAEANPALGDT
jgi:hypothetical protein